MAKAKDKSVLDNIPVQEKGLPLSAGEEDGGPDNWREALGIVGGCPSCGAPVYGKRSLRPDETPVVKHSCTCYRKSNPFPETMQTK